MIYWKKKLFAGVWTPMAVEHQLCCSEASFKNLKSPVANVTKKTYLLHLFKDKTILRS